MTVLDAAAHEGDGRVSFLGGDHSYEPIERGEVGLSARNDDVRVRRVSVKDRRTSCAELGVLAEGIRFDADADARLAEGVNTFGDGVDRILEELGWRLDEWRK